MSLQGRVVLLTRPAGSGPLAARLASLGARVVARPTIAFGPPADPGPMRAAAACRYDWIAVTSPQGARALDAARLPRARVAAVGEGTARVLRGLGFAPEVVGAGDAASFAAALLLAARAGERVLVVRPETARDVLPESLQAAGLRVDAVPFYRTTAAPDVAETAQRLARGEFDAIVFSSPSTFFRLRDAGLPVTGFAHALAGLRRVAIGEVTASALAKAGLPPAAVAEHPTDDGLIEALKRAFSS
jgi:uroporphyrinogen-III synthase